MFLSKIQSMFTHYIVIKSFSESISLLFSLYSFFIFYFWPSLCDLQWHPTPLFLPGKSHGRRSLVGCSPWGRWESDMTERLHFHFSLACIGEGNGNPLQCSCLENPREGEAWWAAVYGVAESRTRLKQLSSSSSMWLAESLFPYQGLNCAPWAVKVWGPTELDMTEAT